MPFATTYITAPDGQSIMRGICDGCRALFSIRADDRDVDRGSVCTWCDQRANAWLCSDAVVGSIAADGTDPSMRVAFRQWIEATREVHDCAVSVDVVSDEDDVDAIMRYVRDALGVE